MKKALSLLLAVLLFALSGCGNTNTPAQSEQDKVRESVNSWLKELGFSD